MSVRLSVPVVAVIAVLAAAAPHLTAASADQRVPLGGGASIVVNGGTFCTLTTIGHDQTGELVGFTAATCGDAGAPVALEGAVDTVGAIVSADDGLDYAVIKLDPAKVTAVADFDGFAINGIGPDPGFLQPACAQGGATGYSCGLITVAGLKPATVTANMPAWQPGDDGAPVTVDGQLVGVTRKGYILPPLPPPPSPGGNAHISVGLFSAILDDVNAKGGAGAGFTAIPG